MRLSTRTIGKRICACMLVCALGAMVGCSQQMATPQEPAPVTPTEYMASVNSASEELRDKLAEFAQAVATGDTFAMQTTSDEARAVIDKMNELEAPEELSEVKAGYEQATASLEAALADYTALYNELVDAQAGAPFDYGAYAGRIEQIQKQYDDGLNALEEADEKAAGDSQGTSSSDAANA